MPVPHKVPLTLHGEVSKALRLTEVSPSSRLIDCLEPVAGVPAVVFTRSCEIKPWLVILSVGPVTARDWTPVLDHVAGEHEEDAPHAGEEGGGDEAEQHHHQFCHLLKLARVQDSLENLFGLPIVMQDLPSLLDQQYEVGSQTMLDHLYGLFAAPEEVESSKFCFTSDLLSGPLTLLEAADKWLPNLTHRESLKVHIAGASDYDLLALIKWEFLAHRLPALKVLDIRFIGPSLKENNNNQQALVEPCDGCSKLGRVITHGFYPLRYQEFRELEDFSTPDLVMVQNCGFHEFPLDSQQWTEGWAGLGSLLHQSGAPVVFTSYTRAEAREDLRRFQEDCGGLEVEVLVQSEENKMRSYRPRRDMGLEEEIDVFYNNFYINIVRLK